MINKTTGLILIIIGCAAGSLLAVMEVETINWVLFIPALIVGAIGVVISQVATHRTATNQETLTTNFGVLDQNLRALVENSAELEQQKTSMDVYDLPDHIDTVFPASLNAFADARESLRYAHGADAYASVMTHFAAGERYLNRVWSCSSDGYIDEAHTYITRAAEQFTAALEQFKKLS